MLNRLFTWLSTPNYALRRKIAVLRGDNERLWEWVRAHAKQIKALEEHLQELQSAHFKLRGRFYASGKHKDDGELPTNRRLTPEEKAALLRAHNPLKIVHQPKE